MTPANFRNFLRDRRANVAMMFGLMAVPLIFIVGMGIDYGTAARLKSKMNAAADAAVLAAVTPAMMSQSDAASTTAATNMFNALVTGLPRLIYNSSTGLTVTVQDVGLQRTVTVAYNAQSQNLFGGVLNMNTIAFGGTSTGAAATPPNINFYLMLDDSPSMAIAGTPADITTMVNNTSAQSGCAFACHEANPAGENPALGNPRGEDNYALARSLGVTLRADLLDLGDHGSHQPGVLSRKQSKHPRRSGLSNVNQFLRHRFPPACAADRQFRLGVVHPAQRHANEQHPVPRSLR